MKLLAVIVTNIIILIIFDQAPITTEARKLRKTIGQDHFKDNFKPGVTDDFAPTAPGNSPGVGHKKARNSPGMGHKKGDDFKPTTPGHSPGIGHAVKNDEPKA
ncbi:hypothetical protein F2Q69_00036154 [Brassica cretica]|uniref:Uncharacterized protein n=1 Tax=Brassica cretica TaxID=69181 RepID=A0A8S9SHE2_BRACR|nr:hypothetical protein F2Q69_00036154 [Brassica cretica]